MAALATQSTTPAGTLPTYVAASAGGDTVEPGPDTAIHVKNTDVAATTVTVASPTACNQGTVHNLVVSVPAGSERLIGPLHAQRFAQAGTGRANITYSSVTGLTIAAIRI